MNGSPQSLLLWSEVEVVNLFFILVMNQIGKQKKRHKRKDYLEKHYSDLIFNNTAFLHFVSHRETYCKGI